MATRRTKYVKVLGKMQRLGRIEEFKALHGNGIVGAVYRRLSKGRSQGGERAAFEIQTLSGFHSSKDGKPHNRKSVQRYCIGRCKATPEERVTSRYWTSTQTGVWEVILVLLLCKKVAPQRASCPGAVSHSPMSL